MDLHLTVVSGPASLNTKVILLLLIARVFAVKERDFKALRWFMTGLAIVYLGTQAFRSPTFEGQGLYAHFGLLGNHGQHRRNRAESLLPQPVAHLYRQHICGCTDRHHHLYRSSSFALIYALAFLKAQDAYNIATERRRSRVSSFLSEGMISVLENQGNRQKV